MTPLIILLIDFGHALSLDAAGDRLATLTGCLTAVLFGYLPWFRLFGVPALSRR